MTKIRVHEYAKQVNKTSKEVIEALSKLNVSVTNHMSMLEKDIVSKLNQTFKATPEKNVGKQATQNISQKPQSNGQQNHSVKKQEGQRQQSATSKPKANNQQHTQQHSNSSNEKSKNAKGNQNRNMTQNNNNNNNNNNRRGGGGYNQRPKPGIHGGKRRHPKTHQPSIPLKQKELPEKITFVESLSVAELAKKLHREPSEIIKKLFMLGVMATINQELDKDAIELICADYGVEVEEEIRVDITDLETHFEQTEEVNEAELSERPPVVTIMGHVDHGKTTLLDSIRNTKVTAGEAGGITQHIGAYQVTEGDKKITFLDTPGHAAFTTMRARGAKITDLTILVVAADDGVMPQTVEAINHAKAAEVPIIVAVNKMDKPSANPDRVMQELTEHGLVPEAWGGETIFVPISALKGEGIDTLLEMILLVAEVGELKANPDRLALGTVIEAQLDKGRGSVATLLVQDGTLKVGDPIVVGHTFGRVRAMVNDKGRRVKEAGPSTPVEITGLNDVPQAGDRFVVFEDEKTARQVGETRAMSAIQAQRSEKQRVTLDNLFEQMSQGEMKELNLIVKADVQGTVEAMAASLMKIDVEGVNVKIIHTGAGAITESDISLAAASNAIVIGFNVRPDVNAKRAAEEEGVDIRLHRIIYKVIEEIEQAMKGMLDPEFEEKIIGQAEVRQTIKVSKVGTIAGSYIIEGKVTRDSGVRVIRDNVVIFEGELDTLKRFKDEVKEVARGYECGITITNFNDIREGDIIEAYIMEEVKRV
ncbi:translation initiation factor IF-2 [Lysinibacillus fusiformis]|uniref:translation initiation factor IF-2 n=1 Tax=Lysinibacillus fusiformis TaxID=28031 RepID=UPI0000F38009|nr:MULTISPECIES: translation initiation factor IF-2 [Lysinibacillus]EAZ84812.1 translation initiation factor IF-2 [Bacillus sp. B14905]MED4074884.1 translation initiation factor IF-2 [Lysinibacillus fusiformis]MED4668699.1 translation initiation factor IF-2 [Lysinibacillus fusiformis]NOG27492.1 translation initiation factor IF-2 [Lysinibacillus fusiformis]PCD83783.1 translation initiation factor IF-2 [Lysinibacillus fusiformis]